MPIPSLIRFHGALYRIAIDDPFEQRTKELQDDGQQSEDPFDVGEDAPVSKEPVSEEPLLQPAEYVNKANELIDKAADDAASLLTKSGVAAAQQEPLRSIASDGVEITYGVAQGALSQGSFDNPAVIFDYALQSEDSDSTGIWEHLKDSSIGGLAFLFKGYTLKQVVFDFCDHYFGADPDGRYVGDLLKAVNFLQDGVDEINTESRLELPKDDADAEAIREWVKDFMVEIWENRVDRNSNKEVEDWYNLTQVGAMISALTKHKYINSSQEKKILSFLGDTDLNYKEFMEEVEARVKGTAQKQIPLKTRVERAVQALTKHEKYSGAINYGIDDKTGHIIASINAPYGMLYVFEKEPGGKITFVAASMNICNQTLVVKNKANAKGLLSTNLTLAEAYKAAVNVEDRSKRTTKKELSQELIDLLAEQAAKQSVEKQEPAPEGGRVPAEDAGLRAPV